MQHHHPARGANGIEIAEQLTVNSERYARMDVCSHFSQLWRFSRLLPAMWICPVRRASRPEQHESAPQSRTYFGLRF